MTSPVQEKSRIMGGGKACFFCNVTKFQFFTQVLKHEIDALSNRVVFSGLPHQSELCSGRLDFLISTLIKNP